MYRRPLAQHQHACRASRRHRHVEDALERTAQVADRIRGAVKDMRAVFDLYERLPEEDGYGLFSWLMHALEATGGYETQLLESVSRKPGGFNVMMIGRLVNADVLEFQGTNLLMLLRSLAARTDISLCAKEAAESILENRCPQ